MKFPALVVLAAATGAGAQTLTITGAPASVAPGASFTFTVSAAGMASPGWAAIAFGLTVNGATLTGETVAAPAAAAKDLDCSPIGIFQVCLVIGALVPSGGGPATGLNSNAVTAATPIAMFTATAPQTGNAVIAVGAPLSGGDPNGLAIPVSAGPSLTIPVTTPFCDLDGNGVVDGNDVSLEIDWINGVAAPPAGKSAVRIAGKTAAAGADDAMVVVRAALAGGVCAATQ